MGSLVKSVYNTLAAIMMFFIHLPSEDGNNSAIFVFVGAAIYITVAMILVFRAIHRNDNSYNFLVKLCVGAATVLTVARYAVMKIHGSFDKFGTDSFTEFVVFVFEFDGFGDGDAIMSDNGCAVFFFDNDVFPFWTKSYTSAFYFFIFICKCSSSFMGICRWR